MLGHPDVLGMIEQLTRPTAIVACRPPHVSVPKPGPCPKAKTGVISEIKKAAKAAQPKRPRSKAKPRPPGVKVGGPPIEHANAYLHELAADAPAQLQPAVIDGIKDQAALAPYTALRLKGFAADRAQRMPEWALAEYLPDTATIELTGRWADEAGLAEHRRPGFDTPTGTDSPLAATVAHEYGHHVASQIYDITQPGMPKAAGVRLMSQVAAALGVDPPADSGEDPDLLLAKDLRKWWTANKGTVKEQVSENASWNVHELFAEAWQEYSTRGVNARPVSKRIGEAMAALAERAAAGGGPHTATPDIPPGPADGAWTRRAQAAARGKNALSAAPISGDTDLERLTEDRDFNELNVFGVPGGKVTDAVGDYKDNGYMYVNWALRLADGDPARFPATAVGHKVTFIPGHYTPKRATDMVTGLDALMAASRLKSDVVVQRGIVDPQATFGAAWLPDGDNTGMQWLDPAYVSTGTKESTARSFAANGAGVVLNILVPKGTGAAGITQQTGSTLSGENELLLQRGLEFRVVRDYTDDGVRTVDVEVVGR